MEEDGQGRVHYTFNDTRVLAGVRQDTGLDYRQPATINRTHFWTDATRTEVINRTTVIKWAYITKGSAPNRRVTGFLHQTFNANGEETSFKLEPTTFTCS